MQTKGESASAGEPAPRPGTCPRCSQRPSKDAAGLCQPCIDEEAEEARAGAQDNTTARDARKESAPPAGKKASKPKAEPTPAPAQQPLGTGAPANGSAKPETPKTEVVKEPAKPAPAIAPPKQVNGITISGSTGRKDKRPRICIYGPGSVGKTTFACEAPSVAVIPCETGADGFPVFRFDELDYGNGRKGPPRTYLEVDACLQWLITEDHAYEWVALDGGGALEAMIFRQVIADYNRSAHKKGEATTINDVGGGFKNGQDNAVDMWRRILAKLDRLREHRNMGSILTLHALIRKFNNPEGDDFDRYQMKLDERGAGVLFEWADIVLFANFRAQVQKQKRGRAKGIGGRERMIFTERTDAYDAKARSPYALPAHLAMPEGASFSVFEHEIEIRKSPDLILKEIERALETLTKGAVTVPVRGGSDQPIAVLVRAELDKRPSPERLAQIKNRLLARVEALEEKIEAEAEAAAAQAQPAGE